MSEHQDLQLELWKRSLANVHTAQDRLRNTIQVFLVASFGISAFLLGGKSLLTTHGPLYLAVASDTALLVVLRYLIQLSGNDITIARSAVEFYEQQFKQSIHNPNFPLDLFPNLNDMKPQMELKNEVKTAWVSFGVVALKALSLLVLAFL